MTKQAIRLEDLLPFAQYVIARSGLIGFKFSKRLVRLVNQRIESAAVVVQETHAPKGEQRYQHKQPDRGTGRAGGRFDFLRPVRWVRVGVHLGGALVAAAAGALVETAGAFVEAATATVIGVSKMTVSARKLRR